MNNKTNVITAMNFFVFIVVITFFTTVCYAQNDRVTFFVGPDVNSITAPITNVFMISGPETETQQFITDVMTPCSSRTVDSAEYDLAGLSVSETESTWPSVYNRVILTYIHPDHSETSHKKCVESAISNLRVEDDSSPIAAIGLSVLILIVLVSIAYIIHSIYVNGFKRIY